MRSSLLELEDTDRDPVRSAIEPVLLLEWIALRAAGAETTSRRKSEPVLRDSTRVLSVDGSGDVGADRLVAEDVVEETELVPERRAIGQCNSMC